MLQLDVDDASAEYHDGYLSVYFNNGNFHEISKQLSPIQEEAIWCALLSPQHHDPSQMLQNPCEHDSAILAVAAVNAMTLQLSAWLP